MIACVAYYCSLEIHPLSSAIAFFENRAKLSDNNNAYTLGARHSALGAISECSNHAYAMQNGFYFWRYLDATIVDFTAFFSLFLLKINSRKI